MRKLLKLVLIVAILGGVVAGIIALFGMHQRSSLASEVKPAVEAYLSASGNELPMRALWARPVADAGEYTTVGKTDAIARAKLGSGNVETRVFFYVEYSTVDNAWHVTRPLDQVEYEAFEPQDALSSLKKQWRKLVQKIQ